MDTVRDRCKSPLSYFHFEPWSAGSPTGSLLLVSEENEENLCRLVECALVQQGVLPATQPPVSVAWFHHYFINQRTCDGRSGTIFKFFMLAL